MNTSDFFLSFVSTFPTSLSNEVIYVLAFLFLPVYLWSQFLLPWNLIQTERIRNCGSPVVSRKSRSRHRWFCTGDFCQIFFILTLSVALMAFIQLLCNAPLIFSNFHAGEEMAYGTKLVLCLVFIAFCQKIDFMFQWSRRGEVISALYSQEGGRAVWMDLVWYWFLYIKLSFNWVWCLFGLYSIITIPKHCHSMIILLLSSRSLALSAPAGRFLVDLKDYSNKILFMLLVYLWANLLVCFYLESFC